jgi:ubiquinone biosynthesis protein COQ9
VRAAGSAALLRFAAAQVGWCILANPLAPAHVAGMSITETDRTMIAAVFEQAALRGWSDVSIADAARTAGVPLGEARARMPGRGAVLMRFGLMADLANVSMSETPRERLFDIVMARFDALQQHRAGVLSLLAALRTDPGTSLLLYGATLRSMKWLLDGAGIPATGIVGGLRVHGLLALWLYALRAWEGDESADLSATMAAVDRGTDRAIQPGQHVGISGAPMSPAEAAAEVFEEAGMTGDEAAPGAVPDGPDLPPAPPSEYPESPIT